MNLKKWSSIAAVAGLLLGTAAPAGYAESGGQSGFQALIAAEPAQADGGTGSAAEGQEQTLRIVHTPASATHEAGQDLTVSALITGAQTTVTASVYYRVDGQDLEEMSMVGGSGDEYSAALKGSRLTGSSLTYYIEARDEEGTSARSDDFTVELVRAGSPASKQSRWIC